MTTQAWQTISGATDNATFRTIGSSLSARLASLGCVQTGDTGQINWSTVTYPAQNADAGYEIWRFADSLQGTAPIYFKITYGRPNVASSVPVRITLQVGTGSNGTGTLTGTALSTSTNCTGNGNTMVGGKLSVAMNTATNVGNGNSESFFAIHRTSNSSGDDTATGCLILCRALTPTDSNLYFSTLNFQNAAKVQDNVQGYNVQRTANLADPGIGNTYKGYVVTAAYPQVLSHIGLLGVIDGQYWHGSTFTATPFGATPHTFISMNGARCYLGSTLRLAMLWE
jgi:hypothetical protein